MTGEQLEAVNALQEPPPPTTLTGTPRDRYLATRAAIATWEPKPCPPQQKDTP